MKLKRGKVTGVVLAVTLMMVALLGGTYAWHMISQQATNEVVNRKNPGGRLHDDFNGLNLSSAQAQDGNAAAEKKVKKVYVENFTDENTGDDIYARIRLDEYLELGTGAGMDTGAAGKEAESIIENDAEGNAMTIEDQSKWTTYLWDESKSEFRKYIELGTGTGEDGAIYMPTFNMDKDSVAAQVNGTLAGPDGDRLKTLDAYEDYEAYEAGATKTSVEVHAYDFAGDDEIAAENLTVEEVIAALYDSNGALKSSLSTDTHITVTKDGQSSQYKITNREIENGKLTTLYVDMMPNNNEEAANIKLVIAEHEAKAVTEMEGVISMTEWLKLEDKTKGYWVYDTDGWVYWSLPIKPQTATGCLLNAITVKADAELPEEYFYGLNVVAQFATAGDWGDSDAEDAADKGFYEDGITKEALTLLNMISGIADQEAAKVVEEIKAVAASNVAKPEGYVTIDGEKYYVIYKDADNTEALLWKAEAVRKGIAFSSTSNLSWEKSNVRTYLQTTFANQNSTIKAMVDSGKIPETTLKTRNVYNDNNLVETTDDTIFVLSTADIDNYGGSVSETAEDEEYTIPGTKLNIGWNAVRYFTKAPTSTSDEFVWLRNAFGANGMVAAINHKGNIAAVSAGNAAVMMRPAFKVSLTEVSE